MFGRKQTYQQKKALSEKLLFLERSLQNGFYYGTISKQFLSE
jgi:hypothetical protein